MTLTNWLSFAVPSFLAFWWIISHIFSLKGENALQAQSIISLTKEIETMTKIQEKNDTEYKELRSTLDKMSTAITIASTTMEFVKEKIHELNEKQDK